MVYNKSVATQKALLMNAPYLPMCSIGQNDCLHQSLLSVLSIPSPDFLMVFNLRARR